MTTIINVGIKIEQKDEISDIIKEKRGKYKSINEFVQESVKQLILKEKSKRPLEKQEELDEILIKIEKFIEDILEDELDDKISITEEIAEEIKKTLNKIKGFGISFKWEDKTQQLISAIELKDCLNSIQKEILKSNKKFPKSAIPQRYIDIIDKLKNEFINLVKSIKGGSKN